MLLERCEQEARRYGFTQLELMATLPGVKLYGARGYAAFGQVDYDVGGFGALVAPQLAPAFVTQALQGANVPLVDLLCVGRCRNGALDACLAQ